MKNSNLHTCILKLEHTASISIRLFNYINSSYNSITSCWKVVHLVGWFIIHPYPFESALLERTSGTDFSSFLIGVLFYVVFRNTQVSF